MDWNVLVWEWIVVVGWIVEVEWGVLCERNGIYRDVFFV